MILLYSAVLRKRVSELKPCLQSLTIYQKSYVDGFRHPEQPVDSIILHKESHDVLTLINGFTRCERSSCSLAVQSRIILKGPILFSRSAPMANILGESIAQK